MTADFLAMQRRDDRETFESTCRITKPGEGYTDDSGVWHPPVGNLVYAGACSFLPTAAQVRTADTAGQVVEVYPYTLKVPASTPVEQDHVVKITACPDPGAVGRFYTVRAVRHSQWQVNRVAGLEEGRV